jgi:hypothetical protein
MGQAIFKILDQYSLFGLRSALGVRARAMGVNPDVSIETHAQEPKCGAESRRWRYMIHVTSPECSIGSLAVV